MRIRFVIHLLSIIVFTSLLFAMTGCAEEENPAENEQLPLLPAGQHAAVAYPEAYPAAQPVLNAAYQECLIAGSDCGALAFKWSDLETTPGVIDTSDLEAALDIYQTLGLKVYLTLRTIDTNNLTMPSDLVDSSNPNLLANGRHFNDPVIVNRFNALLDAVVPLLVNHGGFYLAVGNEVNVYLSLYPAETTPFADFTAKARKYCDMLNPDLAVGANMTFGAVQYPSSCLSPILNVCDVASFTYYPLNSDFTVRNPSCVAGDMDTLLDVVGDRPLLLQEVGYPAGYEPTPSNGSTTEKQRQFVENLFAAVKDRPQIRYIGFFMLSDFRTEDLDLLVSYYGVTVPLFREYLATLGVRRNDGTEKPAYDELLAGLSGLQQ